MNALKMKGSILFILFSINLLFAAEKAFYEGAFDTENVGLFLPVQIDGGECMFLFDTGASFVVLDRSYRHLLGKPLSLKEAESHLGLKLSKRGIITPNGEIALELYKAVPLKLGRFQIANRFPYVLADLKPLWPLSGVEFCGVLGSSFLHQFRWSIDFEKGNIKGYIGVSAYGNESKRGIPIHWSRAFIPQLKLFIQGKEFLLDIDTGDIGSGRFTRENLIFLKSRGVVHSSHQKEVFTVSGSSYHEEFRLQSFDLNGHEYPGLVFQESKQNALGMAFFRRHSVVFDFPFNRLYLEPNKDYQDADTVDKSGVRLILQDGKVRVTKIVPLEGAKTEGLRSGDEVISIDGEKEISLYQARKRLRGKAGRQLNIGIKRDMQIHEVDIVLGKNPLP